MCIVKLLPLVADEHKTLIKTTSPGSKDKERGWTTLDEFMRNSSRPNLQTSGSLLVSEQVQIDSDPEGFSSSQCEKPVGGTRLPIGCGVDLESSRSADRQLFLIESRRRIKTSNEMKS